MKENNYVSTYLSELKEKIVSEKRVLMAQSNKNQIEMLELNNKILEIRNKIDDAYEIFSPMPRTSQFSKTEVAVLLEKQNDLKEENKKLHKKINSLEDEESKIEQCIELIENGVVLSKSLNETKCIQHYCADLDNRVKAAGITLKSECEKIKNQKNSNIIDNMINEFDDNFRQIKTNELIECIDSKLQKINSTYNDRIGVFYDGTETSVSDFIANIAYRFITGVLSRLLEEYTDNEIILKVSASEKSIIFAMAINNGKDIEFEAILEENIGYGNSELTYMDLLNLCNGSYIDKNVNKRKEIAIKVRG